MSKKDCTSSIWYSRYVGDYMRDTADLTLIEHGAYSLLLDHYYSTCSALPNDNDKLYRICRAFTEDEKNAVEFIANRFFYIGDDDLLHNKRADIELVNRSLISEKRSRAAIKKWELHNANADANADANALQVDMQTGMQNGCKTYANHSHNQNHNLQLNSNSKNTHKPPRDYKPTLYSDTLEGDYKPTTKTSTKFTKPTIEDVRKYCKDENLTVDAEHWFNYYESNGWKVGKNPMKNWKASIKTWERNSLSGNTSKNQSSDYMAKHDKPWEGGLYG